MKIKLKVEREFVVKHLLASVGVRHWEDAEVNGQEDVNGELIPCRKGDVWMPIICVESGVIENWDKGTTAKIHYKVCDAGSYELLDENQFPIKSIDGYVPSMMCPERDGFGDYIIMNIDENGQIQNWVADFEEWQESE